MEPDGFSRVEEVTDPDMRVPYHTGFGLMFSENWKRTRARFPSYVEIRAGWISVHRRCLIVAVFVLGCGLALVGNAETSAEREERMGWWREARFGMFIHWGVYAVPAGTYNGRQFPGIGEWIMQKGRIPVAEYKGYAKEFNPTNYNPDSWVKAAKAAGMKYIVITAKHHDGFALFDSKASDWNVVKASPYGKDLLKPLAEACRKEGIKLGFFYSQSQDWINGGTAAGGNWDKAQERELDEYIAKVAAPQVKELMSLYGPDVPAVFWWDTPMGMTKEQGGRIAAELKRPPVGFFTKLFSGEPPPPVQNNRLWMGYAGDFETPEQVIPSMLPDGRDWETCMTMNDTWGFKSFDQNWKSSKALVRNLVNTASRGGNYLLNVGPMADGSIPQPSLERLAELGRWMDVNGESIHGTQPGPFSNLPWGRCTQKIDGKKTTLYLHVFDWPKNGLLEVPGLKTLPEHISLLAGGGVITGALTRSSLTLALPPAPPSPLVSVVRLDFPAPPQIDEGLPRPGADGSILLFAQDAHINPGFAESARKWTAHGRTYVSGWIGASVSVAWRLEVARAGEFDVEIEYAGTKPSSFTLLCDGVELTAKVEGTPTAISFQTAAIGRITLPSAGRRQLFVKPVRGGWNALNFVGLKLKPVPLNAGSGSVQ